MTAHAKELRDYVFKVKLSPEERRKVATLLELWGVTSHSALFRWLVDAQLERDKRLRPEVLREAQRNVAPFERAPLRSGDGEGDVPVLGPSARKRPSAARPAPPAPGGLTADGGGD